MAKNPSDGPAEPRDKSKRTERHEQATARGPEYDEECDNCGHDDIAVLDQHAETSRHGTRDNWRGAVRGGPSLHRSHRTQLVIEPGPLSRLSNFRACCGLADCRHSSVCRRDDRAVDRRHKRKRNSPDVAQSESSRAVRHQRSSLGQGRTRSNRLCAGRVQRRWRHGQRLAATRSGVDHARSVEGRLAVQRLRRRHRPCGVW